MRVNVIMHYNEVNIPCENRTCSVAYEVAKERNISACLEKVFAVNELRL
jgi:hypothetical protein